MKVISSSRIFYMCSLILITSIAWNVVKPNVVNAYDVSGFYGAGNCKCKQDYSCTASDPACRNSTYYRCQSTGVSSHNCTENTNTPCGSRNYCENNPGANANCTIMDG